MSLSRRTSDVLIGLLVIGAIVVMVAALNITRRWGERRYSIYMRTSSAQDLTVDTKVLLQGLEVGEVSSVVPHVDSAMGPLSFVVALNIRERYADGTLLRLPVGTRAEIGTPGGLISSAVVSLQMPATGHGLALQPGDTINATRLQTPLETLGRVADSLKEQVSVVLADTRTLIERLVRTTDQASRQLAATAPEVRHTLAEVQQTMAQLRPVLARADTLMTHTDGRFGTLHDSITVTLSQARRVMADFDSLSLAATGLTLRSEADLQRTLSNFYVISAKLDHFLDQVSRRPLRMITGVRPLSLDSLGLQR